MKRALLLLVPLTGCLIVPATKTTRKSVGTEPSTVITRGAVRDVVLAGHVRDAAIVVRATERRDCHQDILAVTEVTTTKRARLGGVDDPRGRVFGAVLAPITIPLSALVTGAVVAADSGEVTRETKVDHTTTFACSNGAPLRLDLAFPSGTTYHAHTNRDGELSFAIPDSEPYQGVVTVSAASVSRQLQYALPKPAVASARDAVLACKGEHHVDGVELKLAINATGRATRLWLSAGDDAFIRCVSTKLAGAIFPDSYRGKTIVLAFES